MINLNTDFRKLIHYDFGLSYNAFCYLEYFDIFENISEPVNQELSPMPTLTFPFMT